MGESSISEETFRHWWARNPPAPDTPEAREALLNALIGRARQVERARAANLEDDPAVVEAYESLLIARLREIELQPLLADLEVTEEELRTEYESLRDTRFRSKERRRLAVLWLDSRGQEPLALRYRAKLGKLHQELISGEISLPADNTFGSLAVKFTEHHPSRYRGGDVGWIEEQSGLDSWRQALSEIGSSLTAPGNLSEVVVREEGVFLVRLIETAPPQTRPFEAVRAQLERELLTTKRQETRARFEQPIADGDQAVIDREALLSLTGLPTRAAAPERTGFPELSSNKKKK